MRTKRKVAVVGERTNVPAADGKSVVMPTLVKGTAVKPLTPNDHYSGRTAPLTSEVTFYIYIYIYSTNIGTEYFKHGIYSPSFVFKRQFVS